MRVALAALLLLSLAPLAAAKETTVTIHAGTAADGALYFEPATIRAAEGDRVALTLVNDDPSTPHDWALLAYGGHDIEVYVKGGETRTIHFTAQDPGTFRIVCQVVGHKQRGMEGALVVEDKLLTSNLGLAASLMAIALALASARRPPK